MSEETSVVTEIVKGAVRFRYPWKSLSVIGSSFTIPADNTAGVTNARQLCYAANQAAKRKQSDARYKAAKQADGSVIVQRVA